MPLLRSRPQVDGKATAHVGERFTCRMGVADPAYLRRELEGWSLRPCSEAPSTENHNETHFDFRLRGGGPTGLRLEHALEVVEVRHFAVNRLLDLALHELHSPRDLGLQ